MTIFAWKRLLFSYLFCSYLGSAWAGPASARSPHTNTYRLKNAFNASNFFDEFDFFTASDPSHGTVQYESKESALNLGLASTKDSSIPRINGQSQGVVHLAAHAGQVPAASTGRPSIRLTSQQKYNKGLFVVDLTHTPVAECGIWPALWTSSIKTWPNGGEIDIIEAVNLQTNNEVVLHTGGTCSMTSDNDLMTGMQGSPTCGNADGCTVKDRDANSYGKDFNKAGGGVYAMEWTATAIKVWWWARNHIPKDVAESKPNPQGWPQPVASFSGGGCDFDHLFTDHQIVFDITFCGDWAGNPDVWGQQCAPQYGPSCSSYVMSSKDAFKEAYWEILSLKVYENN